MQFSLVKFVLPAVLVCLFCGTAGAASSEQRAIKKIEILQIEATGSRYEPLQYITPYSQSRHVSDYAITVTWNPAAHKAREDWQLNTVYPFPSALRFWAVYHEQSGERHGRDGFRPSTEGPVEPARIGAVFKDLWLSNPTILASHAEALPGSPLTRGGVSYDRRQLSAHGSQWILLVDRQTGLPAEVSTLEIDPLEGEVTNKIVFSDWRKVSGVSFPFKLQQFVDDKIIRRETRTRIIVNPENAAEGLKLTASGEKKTDEKLRQWGWSMSNFFLRRMSMGAPADADQSRVVNFNEVGDGIYQVTGSSHHNLLIEGPDGLAIVDAVWYPQRSEAILRAMHEKWPDKALKYVILTHHHLDHTGGLLPYADAGAIVVTGVGNEAYFRRILNKASVRTPLLSAVDERGKLDGIGRAIEVYPVRTGHANSALAVYVPDEKLLFNADLYSPGRAAQQKVWAGELLRAIEFYDIDVEKHVGGHGMGVETHEHLLELVRPN